MPTIFVKDDLRAAVEAATGGLVTVHYTVKGMPSYFRWFPRFNLEDLGPDYGSGPHPAFIVNGQVRDGFWAGVYPGTIRNNELLSLPGVAPTHQTYQASVNAARAAGPGFHVMTNAEWSAIALWCGANGFQPRGNTNRGRAHDAQWETGVRIDGRAPGDSSGSGIVLNGSGPVTWRHDGTPAGIFGLVGNSNEFVSGLRVVEGEVQIIENNDAAVASELFDNAAWKAIRLSDGQLVAPGTTGTAKYDGLTSFTSRIENLGPFHIDDVVDHRSSTYGDENTATSFYVSIFNTIVADTGITVPSIMKSLLIAPGSIPLRGNVGLRNTGRRYAIRGGSVWQAGGAGLASMEVSDSLSSRTLSRIAKI